MGGGLRVVLAVWVVSSAGLSRAIQFGRGVFFKSAPTMPRNPMAPLEHPQHKGVALTKTQHLEDFETIRVDPVESSATSNDDAMIFLLPGNPGLCDFYVDLAAELARRTGAATTVVGWRGFSSSSSDAVDPAPRVDLETQIAHARTVIAKTVATTQKVAFVGHSIGALVALDCLASPPDAVAEHRIAAAVAVTPFLAANDAQAVYRAKKRVVGSPVLKRLLLVASRVLRLVPFASRRRLMAALGQPTAHMDAVAADLSVDAMTRASNLRAMLDMAASEFVSPRILDGPDLRWLERGHRDKVSFVYATGRDDWVRPEDPAAMRDSGVHCVDIDANHDVCTRVDTSVACARVVADFLQPRLMPKEGTRASRPPPAAPPSGRRQQWGDTPVKEKTPSATAVPRRPPGAVAAAAAV